MDDVFETEDTSSTSVLPHEMLSQIFVFLPLVDRKAVRLTCRSWYDCCSSVKIMNDEKFVFRTDPGGEHIAEVILRSSSLLNLEFQGLPVKELPANVWKTAGPRIRELEFHMCQWDDETISNIILHCENLTSFVITEVVESAGVYALVYDRLPIAYSPRLLDGLIEKGIRRPKLHTLSIFMKYDEHESVLRKIFLLHPFIKHFTFTLISDRSEFLDPFTISLDNCLNPDTRLESLTSKILTPRGYWGALVDQTGQGLRLKYLETCLRNAAPSPSLEKKIFNFFRSQKNLEVLKLRMPFASKKLFYDVLESCPKLRQFHLNNNVRCLDLKPSEVSRFLASISKLKFLQLNFKLNDSEVVPSFSDLLPNTIQLNLTSLHWSYGCVDSDFRVAFLQRCPSLKHLRLGERCNDTTLQIIFQHLPKLQTLVLDDAMSCTNFGFFGLAEDGNQDGYSIKRLQYLKDLEVPNSIICLTERTALELQLSRLEFLYLHEGWCIRLSEEALEHFASRLPKLRVLVIDYYSENTFIKNTIRLCRHLNNLQRLIFHSNFTFNRRIMALEQEVENIFSVCPSLKYISDDYLNTYTRDPFTGKVLFRGCLKFPENVFEFP